MNSPDVAKGGGAPPAPTAHELVIADEGGGHESRLAIYRPDGRTGAGE